MDKTVATGQGVDGPNAAKGDGLCFVGDFGAAVAGHDYRLIAERILRFIESLMNAGLAFLEPVSEKGLYLESSR